IISIAWFKNVSSAISTISGLSTGGATLMNVLAILRLKESLRRLPTTMATEYGMTIPFKYDSRSHFYAAILAQPAISNISPVTFGGCPLGPPHLLQTGAPAMTGDTVPATSNV